MFGNGNVVINHMQDDTNGSVRVLDEYSRYTPVIDRDGTIDIGFVYRDDGLFSSTKISHTGMMDIFTNDIIVRCSDKYSAEQIEMKVHTIGSLTLGSSLDGALSVGPMLDVDNFNDHSINSDASLGNKPPFIDRPMARTLLYEMDGMVHVRLFDGRPGSEAFNGVTPKEAVDLVKGGGDFEWGCFLDPGQTAKLCIRNEDAIESYGNRHYLKWPSKPGGKYTWTPNVGRPVASAITL